jgi:regulator of protease activity HflC (stomatin/prohibitin superfamily)
MVREIERKAVSGWLVLPLLLVVLVASVYGFVTAVSAPVPDALMILAWVAVFVIHFIVWLGFFIVNPNEAKVLQLFGSYVGTVKTAGFHWANPFYSKRRISLRIRNFETTRLKVNDHEGNPIEIASVVVWKVVETAEACFHVDDYNNYVHVQSESALRNLATSYSYDSHVDSQMSLRGNTTEVAAHLKTEIQDRLSKAGVEVIEARISHLAYAPEIAAAMLQRQQAAAIIAARTRIVEGAVGMVEMALERLNQKHIVHLDEERKATMVSNLLVVLCGERAAQPVVNTGSLYQ